LLEIGSFNDLTLADLNPNKLYTVSLFSIYKGHDDPDEVKELVHSFVFETSRYTNFAEQIQSFNLGNNKEALYTVSKNFASNDLTLLKNILFDPTSVAQNYIAQFPEKYDRIMENALSKVFPMDAAVCTEVNVIKHVSGNTSQVIGLLIRSKEPLCDPRIPEDKVYNQTSPLIQVENLLSNATTDTDYDYIFSKDRSKFFVYKKSNGVPQNMTEIPHGTLTVKFTPLEFDGEDYTAGSLSNINFTIS